jgi:hypothetical protein
MRGASETTLLAAIIIGVALLLIIVIIAFNPTLLQGEKSGKQIEFSQFCFHWSMNGYAYDETGTNEIIVGTSVYRIDEYCAFALNKASINPAEGDIETCKKLCRGGA